MSIKQTSENFLVSAGHAGAGKKFSKVSFIDILFSQSSSELAIENFLASAGHVGAGKKFSKVSSIVI